MLSTSCSQIRDRKTQGGDRQLQLIGIATYHQFATSSVSTTETRAGAASWPSLGALSQREAEVYVIDEMFFRSNASGLSLND